MLMVYHQKHELYVYTTFINVKACVHTQALYIHMDIATGSHIIKSYNYDIAYIIL